MKSLKIWSLAVVLLMAMVGCKPTPGPGPGPEQMGGFDAIEKEWKLVSVNGVANEFHVYISFEEGNFALFQQLYTLDFKLFDGTYKVSGNKLTGEYFEGGAWKCGYTGGISEDGNTMTLISDDDQAVKCIYEACTIPEQVRNEAVNGTRSVEVVPFL